jgi:hypothetical protein
MNIFSDSNEDDDGTESHRIYDNPSYDVVGDGDSLVGNLPSWVEDIISDRKSLAEELRKLKLVPSLFIGWPDEEDNSELRNFLGNLGFQINSSYIERGPCSSRDSVVYIKNSKISKIQQRQDKILCDVRRKAIKAVKTRLRKELSTVEVKDEHLVAEIKKLVAILNSQEAEWLKKAEEINKFDERIKNLKERLDESTKDVVILRQTINCSEKKLRGEEYRTKKWIRKSQEISGFYAAWVTSVEAEFGIVIKGPLLELPNGKTFAVESIYGKQLKDQPNGLAWYEAIQKAEPEVEWLQLSFTSPLGRLKWEDEQERFDGRLAWSQIWWVALSYSARGVGIIAPMKSLPTEFLKELKAKKYPAPDDIGVLPDQEARWKELFLKYWGTGVCWKDEQDVQV